MGLEEHQNEAYSHESQEDTENYEDLQSKDKSEKEEPVQTDDEEEIRTPNIS